MTKEKKLTAKEKLSEDLEIYKKRKEEYTKFLKNLISIKEDIEKLVREHDENNSDNILDKSIDYYNQTYLTKMLALDMQQDIGTAILEYKIKLLNEWEDKRDVKDKYDLLKMKFEKESENRVEMVRTMWTFLTMCRDARKELIWNKRAWEYMWI